MEPQDTELATEETREAPAVETTEAAGDALVEQDLLVEDVSIDGMCGVY
ncbi:mycofactocin precursor MftA [Patulibacter sp. S7RM1-6]